MRHRWFSPVELAAAAVSVGLAVASRFSAPVFPAPASRLIAEVVVVAAEMVVEVPTAAAALVAGALVAVAVSAGRSDGFVLAGPGSQKFVPLNPGRPHHALHAGRVPRYWHQRGPGSHLSEFREPNYHWRPTEYGCRHRRTDPSGVRPAWSS